MSYENKEYILQFFEGVHEEENRAELIEVYRKAKAFDRIENLVKTELTSDDLYNDARNNDYVAGMLRVYERVDYIIDEYESGGSDE